MAKADHYQLQVCALPHTCMDLVFLSLYQSSGKYQILSLVALFNVSSRPTSITYRFRSASLSPLCADCAPVCFHQFQCIAPFQFLCVSQDLRSFVHAIHAALLYSLLPQSHSPDRIHTQCRVVCACLLSIESHTCGIGAVKPDSLKNDTGSFLYFSILLFLVTV